MQRWKFRHLFVDEFQDINPLQLHLLEAWRAERPDLCVVGDPDQAIYGWNGADVSALADFGGRYPGSTIVRLETNYRSTPQIVRTASRRARTAQPAHGAGRRADPLDLRAPDRRRRSGSRGATHPRSARAHDGLAPPRGPRPHQRAAHVDRRSAARGPGAVPSPRRRQPARTARGRRRGCAIRAIGADTGRSAPRRPRGVARRGRRRGTWRRSCERAHRRAPTQPRGARARSATSTSRSTRPAPRSASPNGSSATLRTDDISPDADAVDLVTFHRAKGLEWPVVVVTGLERGLVPIGQATTPEALEEETRLLYVALDARRARALHHVGRATHLRHPTMNRSPSPLLASDRGRVRGDAPRAPPRPTTAPRSATRGARSTRPLRRARRARSALHGAEGVATYPRAGSRDARVHDLRRQDPHRDRRERAPHEDRTTGGTGHRPGEARTLRRRGARARVGVRLVTIT